MANRHFGNLADVFKHLALGEMLSAMCPAEYWESHAGAFFYEEPSGATIPAERTHGVHFFVRNLRQSPLLAMSAYGRLIAREQAGSPEAFLQRISGSPALANQFVGDMVRRFLYCDTDAASLQSIRQHAGNQPKIECVSDDGVSVLRGAAMVLSENWAGTTLAFLDPHDFDAPSDSGISPLELWCELASRGIRTAMWYGFADAAGCDSAHQRFTRALDKARLLKHGVQRFEGALKSPAPADAPSQYGFGLLTMHLPGPALEHVDSALKALESLYAQAALPQGGSAGSGAWTYTRAWM